MHGIDYAHGTANVGKSGVRYGVIPMNALAGRAWEELESDYGAPSCPKCGNEVVEVNAELRADEQGDLLNRDNYECNGAGDYACDDCCYLFDGDEAFGDEPLGYSLVDAECELTVGQDGDMFVLRSPYYTHAKFCSPCAPGACYLLNPVDKGGPRCYCLSHDWFEGGKAPYPVWRVDDGELVRPEKAARDIGGEG